jgi:uncharacterized protein (TIGR03067 family)
MLIGLAVTIGAPGTKDPPKKDPPSIVSEWVGEKAVSGGRVKPAPEGGIVFSFSADGMLTVTEARREKPEAVPYKLDAKKSPAEIDITPQKEEKVLGIYKIEGDTLTICFAGGPDAKRPSKFESPEGERIILMTFKRAKKD